MPIQPAASQVHNKTMRRSHRITNLSAGAISFNRVNCSQRSDIVPVWRRVARLLTAAFVLCLQAQDVPVLTRISATARDAVFIVDGTVLTGPAVFTWPAGSKHDLEDASWQLAASQRTP